MEQLDVPNGIESLHTELNVLVNRK